MPLYQLVTLPTKEKYKWLEKEFTLESYRCWLAVARLLGLAGDYICYFAVKNTVGESTGAMGGEADRNLDSLLYSHRLPLVVHLDMTYPCESHKFVSLAGHIIDFLSQTIIFWIDSDI